MRVLVVTHAPPPEQSPGAAAFVHGQVAALRALPGMEVELARFPRGARSYLNAARALAKRSRSERFDLVHAHYGLSGWSALAWRGAPKVVTFHGTDVAHPVVGRLSRLLAPRVALAATASPELLRSPTAPSLRRALRDRAAAVLPTGVDLDRFRPLDRAAARRELGLEPGRRYLLFAADPARPEKRHDRAVALAARHPEADLLVLRGVEPGRVPLWVNAADAVLATSEREGFGLAVVEALACDVPVLSTPVGIAPLALAAVQGALCAPFDESDWSAALGALLAHPDPRIAGRASAALFESARMAERVAAAYADVLERSGSHQRP